MYSCAGKVQIYYEVYGEGKPLILVHGNGESHEIFDAAVKDLQREYKVYLVDSRCHGKSSDTEQISYELMRDDLITLIRQEQLIKPVFYGFSDGGILGLMIAIKEPDLLSKLIISGANLNPKGLKWWSLLEMRFEYLFTKNKLIKMMLKEPDLKPEDLAKIRIPTIVLAGEKDVIRRRHTEEIAAGIRNSVLEILPGENHGSYIIHSEKLYPVLKKYL